MPKTETSGTIRAVKRGRGAAGRRFSTAALVALAAGAVLVPGKAARAGDVAISDAARMHFQAGVALLEDPKAPRYEEAYREFKTAYADSPSYKILSNLGLCAMKIERDKEAINAYETYLKEAGPETTADERAQIQRDLLTLKTGLVLVTISSDPAGATIVDVRTPVEGSEIRNTYGEFLTPREIGLRHGHHTITARLHGYLDQQWEFEATGSAMSPHVFRMEHPPSNVVAVTGERPIPMSAWVSGAITLGLAGTGAILGLAALQKHNDFNNLNNPQNPNPDQAQNVKESGQTLNIAADSVFGAAIVGAIVTTVLLVSRPTERPAAAQSSPSALLPRSLTPALGTRGGGASATWVF